MGTGFFSRSMLKYHAEAWEAGLSGKVTIPLFALGPSGNFAVMLGKWLVSAQKRSKALEGQTNSQAQNEAQKNGLEAEPAMDAGMAFAAMIASSNDFKPEVSWPEDASSTQAEGTVDLEIAGSLDGSYEMGKPKLDEWEISASLVSSLGVSSPIFTTMVTKKTKIWSKTG